MVTSEAFVRSYYLSLRCNRKFKFLSDDASSAIYDLPKMPDSVAWSFITDADRFKSGYINVAFEDRDVFIADDLLHILREYSLEIPVQDAFMNLFVASSEESCRQILAVLRKSLVNGRIVEPPSVNSATLRFCDLTILRKVLSGVIKVISAHTFADMFPCNCPEEDELQWCYVDNDRSPVVTKFMHDICHRYGCFGSKHPLSLSHCFKILLPKYDLSKQLNASFIKKVDHVVVLPSDYEYDFRTNSEHSECESVPVLRPDGRAQQKYSFGNSCRFFQGLLIVVGYVCSGPWFI